jgi:ABC-type proline/glycine betaine transport system permease subunit
MAEACTPVGLHLGLQAEAVLADAVASLPLGVCIVFLGVLLSTTTLWISFLAISEAIFSWAIFPLTMPLVATGGAAVLGHDNLVQVLPLFGDAGHWLVSRIPWDLLAVSRARACVTALGSVRFCSARWS